MREIKFRAWNKEYNRMLDWKYLMSISYGGNKCTDPEIDDSIFNDSDFILMQFTGLCDKNGKEIYEGDIIKTEHGASGICVWGEEKAGFVFDCHEPNWSHPIYGMGGEKEVIGNKYENPELLSH